MIGSGSFRAMANSASAPRQVSTHVRHQETFANLSLVSHWTVLDTATLYDYPHHYFDSSLGEVVFTSGDFAITSGKFSAQSAYSEQFPLSEFVNEGDVLAVTYDSIIAYTSYDPLTESEAKLSCLSPASSVNLRRLITTPEPSSGLSNIPYSGWSYLLGRLPELAFLQWMYWVPDDEGITVVILGSASNREEENKVYDIIGNTLQAFGDPSSPAEIVFINLLDYTSEERKQFPLSGWRLAYDRSISAERSWALAA